MAYDKIVDSAALDATLGGIADAIRAQTGGEALLSLEEMAAAIGGIKNADDWLADVLDKRVAVLINDQITGRLPSQFQNGNKNLVKVDLPHATELGESVFGGCSQLAEVNLPAVKSMAASNFNGSIALKSVRFQSLKTISGYGYSFNNSGVEKVVFDELTSQLGAYDFANCKKLTALVLGAEAVVPLTATTTFNGTPIKSGTGYVYVRESQIAGYKSATNWSTLAAQILTIEANPWVMEV